MNKYSEHFLLNKISVIDFVLDKTDFFKDEKLYSKELSDGNINYVFSVYNDEGKSVVVKQADKFLRSSGRPLDTKRNKIEKEILEIQGNLCPTLVPKIYYYDEIMCALIMEDISAYENLRYGMLENHCYPTLAKDISYFMAKTLLSSTDLVLSRSEKKERVKKFINIELCDISEDLVFTEPYYDYKKRNIIIDGQQSFVSETLYNDTSLHSNIGYLRNNFLNNAQSLLHGDLHSGSIFANSDGIKVIDPEFAFYGPMGYDIGNVVGNLFFSYAYHLFYKINETFTAWAESSIVEIFDETFKNLNEVFSQIVDFPLYNDKFKVEYLKSVKEDTLGYAGTEIIRRCVGDSKVKEITSIEESDVRIKVERILISFGKYLIMNRKSINSGKELISIFSDISRSF